ncbi:ankyrin, partial [Aureobasidium melanogenum]
MGLAKRHVNKYGFTRLAEACENGDLDGVKEWREKDPEQLEQREFAGNTPLQVASLNGYPEIVSYLLEQGCNPHCANADKDTPLIDAVENGHLDVVQILLKAGINPLHCNLKGQQALDVITKETDNATEIRAALREAIEDWNKNGRSEQTYNVEEPASRPGPKQGLQFLARTYENLLKLVSENDRTAVQEFLDARVPVDNNVVAAAAKTGDLYLVNMLLAEMTPKKARQRADRPML